MLRALKRIDTPIALFHHRWPTSTDNVRNACHPFSTKDFFDTNYIFVHNGTIDNPKELKLEHEKLGIKYISEQEDGKFNDSEALMWDVCLYLEGRQSELCVEGNIAFICYAGGERPKLYFGRNSNPLILHRNKNSINLASEGDGEDIEPHILHTYDYKSNRIYKRKLKIPEWVSGFEKTDYGADTGYHPPYGWQPKNDWQSDFEDETVYDDAPTSPTRGYTTAYSIAMNYVHKTKGRLADAFELATDDAELAYGELIPDDPVLLDGACELLLDWWNGGDNDALHPAYQEEYEDEAVIHRLSEADAFRLLKRRNGVTE